MVSRGGLVEILVENSSLFGAGVMSVPDFAPRRDHSLWARILGPIVKDFLTRRDRQQIGPPVKWPWNLRQAAPGKRSDKFSSPATFLFSFQALSIALYSVQTFTRSIAMRWSKFLGLAVWPALVRSLASTDSIQNVVCTVSAVSRGLGWEISNAQLGPPTIWILAKS